MSEIRGLFFNYPLIVACVAWAISQVMKSIINLIKLKKFDAERLFGAGGMPSGHTASVCALVVGVSHTSGVSNPTFAVAAVLAVIVMYDALGIRRAAGEHAKILNTIVDEMDKNETANEPTLIDGYEHEDEYIEENESKPLKEYLGHTPLEVLGGAIVGILTAMLFRPM